MRLKDKLDSGWRKFVNEEVTVVPHELDRYIQSHGPATSPAEHLQEAYNRLYAIWQAMSRNSEQEKVAAAMVEPINLIVAAHRELSLPAEGDSE